MPWTGDELSSYVSILLKTSEEDDPKSMSRFIHQALVRRGVVVQLIDGMRRRGHKSYKNLDMRRVHEKAKGLPENAVPPEIVRLLPHDDDLNKIQVQKAVAPVAGRADLTTAAHLLAGSQPNAVALEKSSYDDADINAQRIAAVRQFASALDAGVLDDIAESRTALLATSSKEPHRRRRRVDAQGALEAPAPSQDVAKQGSDVRVQRLGVTIGNVMVDQSEPWYFGVAFVF